MADILHRICFSNYCMDLGFTAEILGQLGILTPIELLFFRLMRISVVSEISKLMVFFFTLFPIKFYHNDVGAKIYFWSNNANCER